MTTPAVGAVAIKAIMYTPATLTVRRGETMIWTNEDPVAHTVTSDNGAFDSRSIAPGHSWRYVATKPGDDAYHCIFYPNMHGVLKVK